MTKIHQLHWYYAREIGVLLLLLVLLSACDLLAPQTAPTPIFVTATPEQQFIIVTNTPTPSRTPVLAPTLPVTGQPEEVNQRPTTEITATRSITLTPTFTPTPTDTPATPGAFIGPVGGFVASDPADCEVTPSGGFGDIYLNNPELAAQIGCPLGNGNAVPVNNAYQTYERGIMVWVSSIGDSGQPGIYAVYDSGSYQRFNDTWIEGVDPVGVGAEPPPGLVEPIRGFGKVWRESAGTSDALGWATSGEAGGSAFIQLFERGEMVYVPQNGQTYIFVSGQPGTWTSVAQAF